MEDGAIVNFWDSTLIAKLVLLIDTVVRFPHNQHVGYPHDLVLVWPFVPDLLAGVKEPCLGGAYGTDATVLLRHRRCDL